jgi:hypothetical protein
MPITTCSLVCRVSGLLPRGRFATCLACFHVSPLVVVSAGRFRAWWPAEGGEGLSFAPCPISWRATLATLEGFIGTTNTKITAFQTKGYRDCSTGQTACKDSPLCVVSIFAGLPKGQAFFLSTCTVPGALPVAMSYDQEVMRIGPVLYISSG